ncbi:hypothetical protein B5G52_10690 [Pseudoalteromonas sp. A601]|uniref:HEAT repeat domain-containing protein n=1 Tax=Pseudoalteromonas sp. A601 TaxID=1967839 RepID=UPI000B3BEDEE|nr:HEAT repeat domain-containing protein [Pseudoalteromonas sp. A601]OUS71856.1 hypothetical protein B5G52_10690 [Pseudoalteromonas sp. A601]
MAINKGTIAITIATLALVISCYGAFFKDKPSSLNEPKQQQPSPTISIRTPAQYQQSNEALIDELHKKVSSLQRQIANLKLQTPGSYQDQDTDEFKELVLNVLEEKQKQEAEELREQNPLYGFYADLPKDYDLRIKSEPDYAKQINAQLREQILDPNMADLDRLAALSQLQMNMFILNKSSMPEYDYEVVGNILNLANSSSDEKFKIQAIELTTQAPILDQRLAEQFTNLLERDSNDYVRRLAAQGLVAQYYQSQNQKDDYTQQMAQHLLAVYNDTSDSAVRAALDEMIGNQDILDELRKSAGY